ncbi:2-amino-4-hydroxy-6-hydroxymethyldihydropteridinepyrophosphokinase (EC [Bathymodiolus thermophilus thioautotrophic gill symbiont]|jgi:2-amino-4-hydroxy-6-hydroxymethyldihydropteridine diphosphokinase|uniref:2-amino-4-hydroxy-6-hydroxymethyldihydropteridine diphosphokinase n=3 Tax=sulfur-oxidizing symbionts TaxID=32036 RepID=A0A1H6KPJ8_9GAMM|nr:MULTISPECIES: 2-amino-4-hydroxy-6-hydroxymethyldihydropteridine diphosphokinase [Gammaproteobacteria]CAC9484789.1 2-amino-4-hydroxy-6-hydroxymethyldihydropteridine pyrophosphokinase (EC 2.7.6.3) [uncultured Gammaproteobacteria bacterium]CAB5497011.1 2-amino-4-hydroxy-6-hydroxymethyldihydropteridinepyrophosphokinase (EC [Bathymodiolus azoricus thioautotrophic gill symbiont]CAB5503313.1 2-amino-4-hydroxy-6-hydroxymethyldihydropteridinepyrophosphokinase (EC [Bathymodiolus thermophilus thioautotr
MAHIHINIGSNQNRRKNIFQALDALRLNFFDVVCSDIFESNAIGFEGADFYNMGVNATTDLSVVDVLSVLHTIENNQGRDRSQPKFSSREIDLDLVLYDEVIDKTNNLPRDDILQYNFVLAPLAQLNPESVHPLEKRTYQQLFATTTPLKSYNIQILEYGRDKS